MGKGDRKTRRGKIFRGSYGKTRPHSKKDSPAPDKKAKPARKTAKKKPATRAKK